MTLHKEARLAYRQAEAINDGKAGKRAKDELDALTLFRKAIMGALDAHQAMSSQALNSSEVRAGIKTILLNHTNLYEDLRDQARKHEP
jgi:type I restriction enzyme R subunit